MAKVSVKNQKDITLSKEDYLKLLEVYQKLEEVLISKKKEENQTLFENPLWNLERKKN